VIPNSGAGPFQGHDTDFDAPTLPKFAYKVLIHALKSKKAYPEKRDKPLIFGAQGQNRTADTGIFSPLLYRLSYLGFG
jgi:hypothetical protein